MFSGIMQYTVVLCDHKSQQQESSATTRREKSFFAWTQSEIFIIVQRNSCSSLSEIRSIFMVPCVILALIYDYTGESLNKH